MSRDDRHEEWVIKDNLFHQRLSDIRNKNLTDDHLNAMRELNQPQTRGFEPPVDESAKGILTHQDVERIAFYDDLSPVYNFRYLMRKLDREMRRSKRYNRPLSILIIALPDLNRIEADYGLNAQERFIAFCGHLLLTSTRTDIDMVGRYSDDRFIVILPETPGEGAKIVAERLRRKFEQTTMEHQWHKIGAHASIGISHFPGHGTDEQELLAKADIACDMIAERGGNKWTFCPEP